MKTPFLRRPKVTVFWDRRGRFEGAHVALQRAGL